MSASIYYQPVKGKHLPVGAKSAFLAALSRAFGQDREWALTQGDTATLMGLKAGLDSKDQREAVEELLEAIERHGTIRVWAEY